VVSTDEGNSGVQSIGSVVVDVIPGHYFRIIARQTSGATKNVAAGKLTSFAMTWWTESAGVSLFGGFGAAWNNTMVAC